MTTSTDSVRPLARSRVRSRNYMLYLMVFMGLVAVMDQYLSTIKTTAIPYILEAYNISAETFSWYEALFLSATFLIFLLNGLNDIIGRRLSILILLLLMGLGSVGVLLYTPTLTLFMVFYTVVMFTTVSNMWSIPVSEESPAEKRAKYVAIVYVIGLIPLQALMPPLLMDVLGLDWRWMYGAGFVMALPLLVLWTRMKETHRFNLILREREAGTRKLHFFGLGVIDRQDIRYILLSAAIWLCWLIYSFLYFWAGYYFMNVHGYTLSQWSLVLLATLLMAMVGGVLSGGIMDKIGRTPALIAGCIGLALTLVVLGYAEGWLLPVAAVVTGFFTSFTYTWVVVYVPEVFPTERRGACMGWTTTVARVSYVVGPALAAVLLRAFPTMEGFWLVAGAVMLVPAAIIALTDPYETKKQELEEIAVRR